MEKHLIVQRMSQESEKRRDRESEEEKRYRATGEIMSG